MKYRNSSALRLGCAMSLVISANTIAADLSTAINKAQTQSAVADWSGGYVSFYGMYGANITNTTIGIGTVTADLASSPHGPGFGAALGYNFQPLQNGLIFGLRADIGYLDMSAGGQVGGVVSINNATNYLGDLDFVLGLPFTPDGKLVGRINGGFAFGGAKPNLQVASLSAAASDTSTGWNFGVGLDYQLDQHWKLFAQGDYFQLGDKSLTASDPVTGTPIATSTTKYHFVTQKLGVTYQF